jgi:hypothetical protein
MIEVMLQMGIVLEDALWIKKGLHIFIAFALSLSQNTRLPDMNQRKNILILKA